MKTLGAIISFSFLTLISFSQNNCLDFNGLDDYLLVGDVNDLGTNDFTLEAWVNCKSTAGIGQFVICKGITSVGTPSNAGYGIRINDANNNDVQFLLGDASSSTKVVTAIALSTNNWHHIAGVRRGTILNLFVDGNLVATDSTATIFNVNTDIPLSIGAHDKGGMSPVAEFMNGMIDEVRIWSEARTNQQIIDNMDCAITSPQQNLVAVYNMNLGTGMTAVDSSGFANDAIFVMNPVWQVSPVALLCSNGIEDISIEELIIYPNPTEDFINVDNITPGGEYHIYNLMGEAVAHGEFIQSQIQLNEIVPGTYLLKITQGSAAYMARFIVN